MLNIRCWSLCSRHPEPRPCRPAQAAQAGPGGPGRSRRSRPVQAVQAGPGGPGESRPRLARPGYLGEALAEPYTVQAVSGRPCGRPSPPVEKTGTCGQSLRTKPSIRDVCNRAHADKAWYPRISPRSSINQRRVGRAKLF